MSGDVVGVVVGTVGGIATIGAVGTIIWRSRRKKEAEVDDLRKGLDDSLEASPVPMDPASFEHQ
jgi:hypothetical protein